jgi:hypothetical protein
MKKLLILLLAFGASAPLSHLYGQDTLKTPKGKYLLTDAVWGKDSGFVFSANVTKALRQAQGDKTDNCKEVVGWDNFKFSKVLNSDPDFVNYSVATDNPAAKVEYSSDNANWQDSRVLKLRNSTNCEAIFFRLKGCDTEPKWGCVIPFTTVTTVLDSARTDRLQTTERTVFARFSDTNGRIGAADINLTVAKSKALYFLGARGWRHVLAAPEAGLTGYDYNPIIFEQGTKPWEFGDWVQTDVYTSGGFGSAQSPARAVGPDYAIDTTTRLFEFDVKFPEFKLPDGKIVVMDAETERSSVGMLKRGVTFAKNTTDISKRVIFISDGWLHAIGCPPAYTSPQDFQEWLRNTSADRILQSFQRQTSKYRDYGYLMLNWEAVMFNVPDDQRFKLTNCLRWYSEQNYHAKLAAWMQTGFATSRVQLEGDFNLADYAGIYNFSGTEAEFRKRYTRFSGQPDYARYLDVLQVGGYQNFATNDGIIHHYVLEYLANKKFYPTKNVLASVWHDQEHLGNWKLTPVTPAGADYVFWNKPAAFNQTMWNWGVWTVAFGDGKHTWSDPVKWTNTITDYPFGAKTFDGRPLQGTPGKMFARNNLKNIDWMMRGVWEVSQHKDIIDAPTKWQFTVDPAISYQKRELLMAYKLSRDGTEALVLALDMFGGEGVNEHVFPQPPYSFSGKNFTTNGTWTSVIRVKL